MVVDYDVITAPSAQQVKDAVKALITESKDSETRWQPSGPLTCQTKHVQCRYRGQDKIDEQHRLEYAQGLIKVRS